MKYNNKIAQSNLRTGHIADTCSVNPCGHHDRPNALHYSYYIKHLQGGPENLAQFVCLMYHVLHLPDHTTHLSDKISITRMLYKNAY